MEFEQDVNKQDIRAYQLITPKWNPPVLWHTGIQKNDAIGGWSVSAILKRESGRLYESEFSAKSFRRSNADGTWPTLPAISNVEARPPIGWARFVDLPVEIRLDDLRPYERGLELMSKLRGIKTLGNNSVLVTRWRGWEMLVPSISLLWRMAAPSPRVMTALLDPMGLGVKLNHQRTDEERVVITVNKAEEFANISWDETHCLAFWVGNPSYRRMLQSTAVSISQGAPIVIPRAPVTFHPYVNGLTDGKRLLITGFRYGHERFAWSNSWMKVAISDVAGKNCTYLINGDYGTWPHERSHEWARDHDAGAPSDVVRERGRLRLAESNAAIAKEGALEQL